MIDVHLAAGQLWTRSRLFSAVGVALPSAHLPLKVLPHLRTFNITKVFGKLESQDLPPEDFLLKRCEWHLRTGEGRKTPLQSARGVERVPWGESQSNTNLCHQFLVIIYRVSQKKVTF